MTQPPVTRRPRSGLSFPGRRTVRPLCRYSFLSAHSLPEHRPPPRGKRPRRRTFNYLPGGVGVGEWRGRSSRAGKLNSGLIPRSVSAFYFRPTFPHFILLSFYPFFSTLVELLEKPRSDSPPRPWRFRLFANIACLINLLAVNFSAYRGPGPAW